ncbi:hypothetical protein CPB85DRAFT_1310834 [Mucidula mucida]|nr:hypothetical protein CPB85DRAFT_1310834 [Mucidula mucida]
MRSLFQGSAASLAPPSASYPSHEQLQYSGQGHHASATSLVPPVPQMPSLSPGSVYPGAMMSPYGPGPNYYPANPSRTSLMPAPGQIYASTQSLQGQPYAPPAQGLDPALMSRESMRNMPGMAPQQFYGQALDPRDPNFDDPSRQHRLMNEYNQPTSKKEHRPKH